MTVTNLSTSNLLFNKFLTSVIPAEICSLPANASSGETCSNHHRIISHKPHFSIHAASRNKARCSSFAQFRSVRKMYEVRNRDTFNYTSFPAAWFFPPQNLIRKKYYSLFSIQRFWHRCILIDMTDILDTANRPVIENNYFKGPTRHFLPLFLPDDLFSENLWTFQLEKINKYENTCHI